MGCVYRYIDRSDGIIKYVGIVWGVKRTLSQRIKEHQRDPKFSNKKWKIEYIDTKIETRTDAEYFESHYIALYGTAKYLNDTKYGWGLSSYLPDRESDWKEYNQESYRNCINLSDPYNGAKECLDQLFSYNTYDERRCIYKRITSFCRTNGLNRNYFKKVREYMDDLLNVRLFGSNVKCARFNGNGEIILELPFLHEVKYRDYDDMFVFPKTCFEIKRKDMIPYINQTLNDINKSVIEKIKN